MYGFPSCNRRIQGGDGSLSAVIYINHNYECHTIMYGFPSCNRRIQGGDGSLSAVRRSRKPHKVKIIV